MNNPLISIIIPAYNVKQYLPVCLSSIEQQTYQNFEVILIDDGSKDSTGEICETIAAKDNRFKVIHQKNQGVSVARNKGIEVARGEYITFVDSDDEITSNYLSSFNLRNDLEIQGYIIRDDKKTRVIRYDKREVQDDIAKAFCLGTFNSAVWGKLFRTSIIKDNKIIFPVNLCFSEDTIFLLHYIKFCRTLAVSNTAEYIYIKHNGSLTGKKYPINDMILKEEMIINAYKQLFPEPKFRKEFLREESLNIISKYYFYYNFDKKEYSNIEFLKFLAKTYLSKFDYFMLFCGMSCFAYYVRWRHRFRVRILEKLLPKNSDSLLEV